MEARIVDLHKPIFIIVATNSKAEARDLATARADSLVGENKNHDWYQGIKESQRWGKDYEFFDKPCQIISERGKKIIKEMIESTQKSIQKWIDQGMVELKKKGMKDLGWTLSNFSIASGETSAHVFDGTDYSMGEAIVDFEFLENLKKYAKKESLKLWIVGFDIHY